MHLAEDRGTQRMRHEPRRFAVADQNFSAHWGFLDRSDRLP
jgi:hypothetical protein